MELSLSEVNFYEHMTNYKSQNSATLPSILCLPNDASSTVCVVNRLNVGTVQSLVTCVLTPCSLIRIYRRFGVTSSLRLQRRNNRSKFEPALPLFYL